jgi:hypothetical protein
VRELGDGGALGFQAKAALALAVGRIPVVSDEFGPEMAHLEWLYFVETVVSESTAVQD